MILSSLEIIFFTLLFYFIFYFIGLGLSRLLFESETKIQIYSPWMGIVQTGLLSIFLGYLNVRSSVSFIISILLATIFFIYTRYKKNSIVILPSFKLFPITCLLVLILTSPIILNSKKLTSFSIGNNDLFDYCVTSEYLKKTGLRNYLQDFGNPPSEKNTTIEERVVSWQIPAPRWLSYYPLSGISSLLKKDTADLFMLYTIFLFALSFPVLYNFAETSLQLEGQFRILAVAFSFFNLHLITILYHGFLPQVMGTALFLCFFSLFPDFFNEEKLKWKKGITLSLFAAGVLASYLEIFSFLIFIVFLYSIWKLFKKETAWNLCVKKLGLLAGLILILCPYQTIRFLSIIAFHAAEIGGGWRVTKHYYLFPFQTGFFLSKHPEPSLMIEWLLNPILLLFIYFGIKSVRDKKILISLSLPFILAGAIAYSKDWNYRYFKNFTYLYYWAPLLIIKGGTYLCNKNPLHKTFNGSVKTFLFFLILIGFIRSSMEIYSATKHAQFIPEDLKTLSQFKTTPSGSPLLLHGLDFWETLWAGYYLRNNSLLANSVHPYLRNDLLLDKDPKSLWQLTKTITYPQSIIYKNGPYYLIKNEK